MKTGRINLVAVLFVAVMALLVSALFNFNPLIVGGVFFTGSALMPKEMAAFMAVTKEIWTKDIVDSLWKDNEWARRAFNADMYVLQGKVVHIPVAGSPSDVVKNLDTFPQAAIKRVDTELTYAIDTFYTKPRHIEEIEKYELAYDKRQSALGEDQANLIQTCMDNLLYKWAPAVANTILTEGAAVLATVTGGTGNRKAFTKAAFGKVKLKMDKANVLKSGRLCVLTEDHYAQFFDSLSEAEKTDVGRVADLKTGKVGQYLGFDIYTRSTVLRYRGANGAYAPVDELDAAFAASDKTADRAASIFYQEQTAERAKGEVKMFDGAGRPEYYGDIFSFLMRLGGRIRRAVGVYAVVEDLSV